MDDANDHPPEGRLESRAPTQEDLVSLCGRLNDLGAEYVVVGGFAIIHAGLPRTTMDLDLVVSTSAENEQLVFEALRSLPDQAVNELKPGEVDEYTVVRIADEIVVDLMKSAGGIEYAEASKEVVVRMIRGVAIPFASPELLWKMKRLTYREKDAGDLLFLRKYFEARGEHPPGESGVL